jgi:hypothetical protein
MVKPLSAQLADLSARAKNAEDSIAKAQKETHDKVVAIKEKARADVNTALARLDRDIKSAGDDITGFWNSLKAKVAADKTAWDARITQIKHDVSAGLAEDYANQLEWEASFAIAYVEAAIEEAKAATLDAVAARMEAEKAKVA